MSPKCREVTVASASTSQRSRAVAASVVGRDSLMPSPFGVRCSVNALVRPCCRFGGGVGVPPPRTRSSRLPQRGLRRRRDTVQLVSKGATTRLTSGLEDDRRRCVESRLRTNLMASLNT